MGNGSQEGRASVDADNLILSCMSWFPHFVHFREDRDVPRYALEIVMR